MTEQKPASFYQVKSNGVVLSLQVSPGAKKSEFREITPDGFLKIKLNAPAVEGKANQALLVFLSQALDIRKSQVEIVFGEFARKKRVMIRSDQSNLITLKIYGLIRKAQ